MRNKNIDLSIIPTKDLIAEVYNRDDIIVIQSYTKTQLGELLEKKKNIEEFMVFLKKGSYLKDKISFEIKDEIHREFLNNI